MTVENRQLFIQRVQRNWEISPLTQRHSGLGTQSSTKPSGCRRQTLLQPLVCKVHANDSNFYALDGLSLSLRSNTIPEGENALLVRLTIQWIRRTPHREHSTQVGGHTASPSRSGVGDDDRWVKEWPKSSFGRFYTYHLLQPLPLTLPILR